jgi:hypothetical protein
METRRTNQSLKNCSGFHNSFMLSCPFRGRLRGSWPGLLSPCLPISLLFCSPTMRMPQRRTITKPVFVASPWRNRNMWPVEVRFSTYSLHKPPPRLHWRRSYQIRRMPFRWPHNPSPQKVIKETEEILTDALTILSYNTDLISDEEQTSFSEGFSRYRLYIISSRIPPSQFWKAHKCSCRIEKAHGVPQVDRGTRWEQAFKTTP